ncbi:hypothetical protein L1987_69212 [Smallanthus sonchifolius]|uniref:Uncharacterized protein n=1 Tax=Smallanthus sonchifolius TaxID=185202 RepID=A0ACB9B5Q6_9ASTR|nr:hypothetical protein L1987_69212 [Smallanthus sonchifolius]
MDVSEHGMLLGDVILDKGAPGSDSSVDTKLRWLRSQIISAFAEIQTPFGTRKLTYADHTASGRCLRYIEDYIIETVLPFYVVPKPNRTPVERLLQHRLSSGCSLSSRGFPRWRQSLAQVIEIGLDKDGMIDMDDLKLRLEFYQGTGWPMLASFSACSNVTGICSHTHSLARLLHKFGAFACFDFAVRDKPLNGTFVAKLLNDLFGIQARGGCACAGPYGHLLLGIDEPYSLAIRSAVKMVRGYNGAKMGWTRVSFPYYMPNEEYEFILAVIEFVAVYGQRFLPHYHLNWNTGSWTFRTNALEETFLKEKDCKLCASFCSTTHVPKANVQQKVMDCKIMYAFYVEVAKHIGNMLPKFPSKSSPPKDIDPNYVLFFNTS